MIINNKLQKAIEIFKKQLPEAKGKFRAYPGIRPNEVEIYCEDGFYCIVCIRCKAVKLA